MAPIRGPALDLDSDDEFGYDLSSGEEDFFLQLTSDTALAHAERTDPARLTDAVPVVGRSHNLQTVIPNDDSAQRRRRLSTPFDDAPRWLAPAGRGPTLRPSTSAGADITYPDLRRALAEVSTTSITSPKTPVQEPPAQGSPAPAEAETQPDDRSPLQRFRSYPRRPLTVSDLTSGAWCEIQYWYTLTRLPGGRKTRTAAMKQGSKVHKELEDKVHTTVQVDITKKEDGFGLRFWNLIQGLRTLRETGLTRELEVWGVIDGHVVNGIIDGLSYENPNAEFEEELSSQESQLSQNGQTEIADYYPPKARRTSKGPIQKIYLSDTKTRGTLAPVSNTLLRPAKIQLLLYHRFLSEMAAGQLCFFTILRRYGLDPDETFSDAFLAQIGELHEEIFHDASEDSTALGGSPTESPASGLLNCISLRELISLVHEELAATFPHGGDSLGHILRVQYVFREDGRELDRHDFPVSREALNNYLDKYMSWWRGDRVAEGVQEMEAFKCRSCEFASDCTWRKGMEEDHARKMQQRRMSGRLSSVRA